MNKKWSHYQMKFLTSVICRKYFFYIFNIFGSRKHELFYILSFEFYFEYVKQ